MRKLVRWFDFVFFKCGSLLFGEFIFKFKVRIVLLIWRKVSSWEVKVNMKIENIRVFVCEEEILDYDIINVI